MKNVIPFTKELEFETKVSEILSISLEREFVLGEESIEGNLLITGEYKSHEVSVNVLPFSFKIPFSLTISKDVKEDTISLEISDFAYDTIDENKIKVHVELELNYEEKEKEEEEKIEVTEEPENLLQEFDSVNINLEEELERNESGETELVEEENPLESTKREVLTSEEETILNTETKDEYMTYQIHILKEGETLETLCSMYHVTGSFLATYNDITNLNVGDKIIIPIENE